MANINFSLPNNQTTLLVIDVQVDGTAPFGKAVKERQRELSFLTQMLPKLKQFISDLKQKGVFIIYSKHIENEDLVGENTKLLFEKKSLPFGSYQKGDKGSDIYFLQPDKNDLILEKTTWDLFSNPQLNETLHKKGIENLIITGAETECCVFSTVSSAYREGYNVFIPQDLVRTKDHKIEKYHKPILSLMNNYYGYVLDSNEILSYVS